MRQVTVTYNAYSFGELSPAAKARAVQDYLGSPEPYQWGDEAMDAIKALAARFGGRIADWSIDWLGYSSPSWMRFDMPDDMEPHEVLEKLHGLGSFDQETLRGDGDCKLTGYCFDEDAIDGFRRAFVQGTRNLADLMQAAFESWIEACHQDAEYQFSEEGYGEHAEANNLEFSEEGRLC